MPKKNNLIYRHSYIEMHVMSHMLGDLYSRFFIYAARGPCNQTGWAFYTDCQRNAATQTHVSLSFISLYLIITAHYNYTGVGAQKLMYQTIPIAKTRDYNTKVLSTLDDIKIVKD